MGQTIYQVDAFTDKPFSGNPAAVCVMAEPGDEVWMQNLAKEMNLSETAFLYRQDDGFNLRWFTPTVEVDLCGHATLASAHILWETGELNGSEQARFYTHSGLLTAERKGVLIELNFPSDSVALADVPPELEKALGAKPKAVSAGRYYFVVEFDSEQTIRGLKPDFTLLGAIVDKSCIVTSRADSCEYDFVSRFFAPRFGINEDPVTGSAHCCLGPYWQGRLGKDEFTAYQASARGGVLRVRVDGERTYIGGLAVTVMRAEFFG